MLLSATTRSIIDHGVVPILWFCLNDDSITLLKAVFEVTWSPAARGSFLLTRTEAVGSNKTAISSFSRIIKSSGSVMPPAVNKATYTAVGHRMLCDLLLWHVLVYCSSFGECAFEWFSHPRQVLSGHSLPTGDTIRHYSIIPTSWSYQFVPGHFSACPKEHAFLETSLKCWLP